MSKYKNLLNEGESTENLDIIEIGDELIVDFKDRTPRLFSTPIRIKVLNISGNNKLSIEILTSGAKDPDGFIWSTGVKKGWFDIKFACKKIVKLNDNIS